MSKQKPKRIVKHGCYSASNADLGIRDKKGKLMNGEHDVFVMTKASKKGYVKVKTVTSLESVKKNGERIFYAPALDEVRKGIIIPIPAKKLNSDRLSGINNKGFWIHKSKLFKPNRSFKFPKKYESLIK